MNGVELIAAERQRQIEVEGWTPEHDDEHTHHELIRAAAIYALPNAGYRDLAFNNMPTLWPWSPDWYKPSADRIRELAKAGALIAAEIDRLKRARFTSQLV